MTSVDQCVQKISQEFDLLDVVYCDQYYESVVELQRVIKSLYRDSYDNNQRLVFVITKDFHVADQPGIMLQNLQTIINLVDISNFFVVIITTNKHIQNHYQWVLDNVSTDPVSSTVILCDGTYTIDSAPIEKFYKIQNILDQTRELSQLTHQQKKLLFDNKSFCVLPWTAINIEGNNIVRACCESKLVLGDSSKNSLEEIWNSDNMKMLRREMLLGNKIDSCESCYKKESLGNNSLRKSMNRRLLKRIGKVDQTAQDGTLDDFSLNHWDVRYNNLCNLACRSCSHLASSSWHGPAVAMGKISPDSPALLISGRHHDDIFQQMLPHVEHIDNIYHSGGEPLMMVNNYEILEILDQKQRHDVSLVYNTNLTQTRLKGRSIFDLWKKFPNISVGASLDGEGSRAEYLRPGTVWSVILDNRELMMKECPHIDFYVSSTTSILNVLHVPDFHRSWTDSGLIKAEDFNVQVLLSPWHLRVSTAPGTLKTLIREKYQQHLDWLIPRDKLGRATSGFQSILNLIDDDDPFDAEQFWNEIHGLDRYHGTNLLSVFPELSILSGN